LTLKILEYSTFHERGQIFSISKVYFEYSQTDIVLRWLCYRLIQERKVYSPLKLLPGMNWKKTFLELYKIRNLWIGDDAATPGVGQDHDLFHEISKEHFKINVYARFRPDHVIHNNNDDDATLKHESYQHITLPLHQRLSLIKLSCNLKSNHEALKILKEEGSWFGKKWREVDERKLAKKKKTKINGLPYRVSPLGGGGGGGGSTGVVPLHAQIQHVDVGTGRVLVMTPDVGIREFSFDGVFPALCDQKSVYDVAGSRLVADVINGFNATAIMYGQTGSG
jgi:hypothetical protein